MVDQLLSAFGDKMIINSYRYVAGGDPLLDGLIAWWSLDETSGTRVDSHTGGIDLTDNNTVGFATGKVSNAAELIRVNNEYLSTTDDALNLATVDFSFLFWAQFGSGSAEFALEQINGSGFGGYRCRRQNSTSKLEFGLFDSTANFESVFSDTTIAVNTWVHVALTHNASTKTLTIVMDDGTPKSNTYALTPSDPTTSEPFTLSSQFQTVQMTGLMDEVAPYNKVVAAQVITDHYNSGSGIGYPGP